MGNLWSQISAHLEGSRDALKFKQEHQLLLLDQAIETRGDIERMSAEDLRSCGLPIGLVRLLKPDDG